MQSEIPAWGYDTFAGMSTDPDRAIVENGLAQLREMIARDRNHPSVVIWGLANEIGGANPPPYPLVKHMLAPAKPPAPSPPPAVASDSLLRRPAAESVRVHGAPTANHTQRK